MRRVKPAKNLSGARLLLMRRRMQKYLPRRPGRFFGRIALVLLAAVAGIGAIDFVDRGTRLQSGLLATSAALGFSVQQVEVEGRVTTPADDVLKALDVARGMPILSVAPERARQRLETLPWVRAATVKRRLPDTIVVTLSERQPMALWQRDGKLALVDTEGIVVTTEHLERYQDLLLVVGEDAPKQAPELIRVLATRPDLKAHVQSAVLVGGRRWDVHLDDGIVVALPEDGVEAAWAKLDRIERGHGLLERDVTRIDLRLPHQVGVTPSATPAKPAAAKPAKPGTKPT